MKKLYSTIMMLAIMGAALSFTACSSSSSDDDNDTNDISKIEQNTDSKKPVIANGISRIINLKTAGTLSSFISDDEAPNIGELKLSGHMDASDFSFIKWNCMKIEVVDMADVVIDKYKGANGTNEGYDATYNANEIPLGAFFYWNTSKKYDYPGMPKDEGMASLKKIVLPPSITRICRNAFARAYNLIDINIPEGVKKIDFVAFAICQSLKEITLPSTLDEVGKQAFADMTSLEKMTVLATVPPTAVNNSFQGIVNKATLYVPKGSKSLYEKAIGWKEFGKIAEIESGNGYNEDSNPPSSSSFTITYDGNKNEVENTSWINPLFGHGGQNKGNYFCLDNYPLNNGQIHIIFPYDKYKSNVQPSYFAVGYNDFGETATDIEFITTSMSAWYGEYVSGSAKVTKNDGKNITINFSKYTFEVERSGKSHKFVLDGTLTFQAYLYN